MGVSSFWKKLLGLDSETGKTSFIVVISFGVLAGLAMSLFLVNIIQKKQEAKNPFFKVIEITDDIDDPAKWGVNFPLQFEGYRKTTDMERTRYGGSEGIPRTPSKADPRSVVAYSKLEEDPRLKTMWAGYAFSKDFREERGHAYMLVDQEYTERQKVGQPGTCLNCHASTYLAYKRLGGGDIVKGFEALNQKPYFEARKEVSHPVACIDCHNPSDMSLRVTKPAFMEGIKAYKENIGIKNYDVNKDASRQEMRAFVCGQCHVEYYFKGKEKRLTYPWANGLKADQILDYYDKIDFKDWTHTETGAKTLKAQHPEFEMWNQGIHARNGVSCVDCHMPYKKSGAHKITDHHIQSPLLNIQGSCTTCHHVDDKELKGRVEQIQERNHELRNLAMDALMDLISDIKKVKEKGTDISKAQDFQRKAQFLLDFVEAENSAGFHAPQESARILGKSIDYSRKGQNSLK